MTKLLFNVGAIILMTLVSSFLQSRIQSLKQLLQVPPPNLSAESSSVSTPPPPPTTTTTEHVVAEEEEEEDNRDDSEQCMESVESFCRCSASMAMLKGMPVTAARVWKSLETKVQEATLEATRRCWWFQQQDLQSDAIKEYTKNQWKALNPVRMKSAIRTSPHPSTMKAILQILLNRLKDPANNPPLRIAIFGGSVAEGCRAAEQNPFGLHEMKARYRPRCMWAAKLESILNTLAKLTVEQMAGYGVETSNDDDETVLGVDLVQLQSFAIAGTDSDIGSALLEYQLTNLNKNKNNNNSSSSLANFDVFIHSFSSNDALAPPGSDRDRHFVTMQRFNRLLWDQRPCSSDLPLVVQLEDTLTETLDVQGEPDLYKGLRYNREMSSTNAWATGLMTLSYADATRDYIYQNTTNQLLHSYRSLHPGYNMHTGIAYILLYSFLDGILSGACDADLLHEEPSSSQSQPRIPLPILPDENQAKTTEIVQLWQQQRNERSQFCRRRHHHGRRQEGTTSGVATTTTQEVIIPGTADTCEYSWIAARWETATKQQVKARMDEQLTNNRGWKANGNKDRKPKRTWETQESNSQFTMEWKNLQTPVNSFLLVFFRCNDKRWEESLLEVVIEQRSNNPSTGNWQEVSRSHVSSYHTTRSAINYPHRMQFGTTVPVGSALRIQFTLVRGRMFQINGMALCHLTPSSSTHLTALPKGQEDLLVTPSAAKLQLPPQHPSTSSTSQTTEMTLASSLSSSSSSSANTTSSSWCPQQPCNINIAFVGDSITRYQYYSMAYFLRHNRWIDPKSSPNLIRPKDYMEGNEFGLWTQWYNVSAAALAPYENCDCYRRKGHYFLKNICENRYYYDPIRNNTLTYIQAFGKIPMQGHWEADKAFPNAAQIEQQRLEKVGGWKKGGAVAPPIGPFYQPYKYLWTKGWVEMIRDHLSKLAPSHVILNAGKWQHNFDNTTFASQVKQALDDNNMVGIWKTTTAEVNDAYGIKWNHTDHLMCDLFGGGAAGGGGCLNNSGWTQKLPESMYMDIKHPVEPVYRKLNEEIFDHLNIERTVPNVQWNELGVVV